MIEYVGISKLKKYANKVGIVTAGRKFLKNTSDKQSYFVFSTVMQKIFVYIVLFLLLLISILLSLSPACRYVLYISMLTLCNNLKLFVTSNVHGKLTMTAN